MYHEDPDQETQTFFRPQIRIEPTYQLRPKVRFREDTVREVIKEVFDTYLTRGKYQPELCKQLSKTLADVSQTKSCKLQL